MTIDVIALTQEMVRTPSLSGDEGNMAALVERRMRELGFTDVRRDDNGSVLGIVGPEDADLALLFDGHMDVVPVVGEWTTEPFGGEIRDGRLYGRGSTDMKGGIAAALCGVAEAARTGRLTRRVAVSASVMEEVVEGFALASVLDLCSPAAVVICEPSKLQIKSGQKGRMEILLTFEGTPAHAASPECGVNPLHAAAQALIVLQDLDLPTHASLGDALLVPTDIVSTPYPSISMIPTATTIRFDRRTLPGETSQDVLSAIEARLRAAGLDRFTLAVTGDKVRTFTGCCARPFRWLPAWQIADDHALVSSAAQAVQAAGRTPSLGTWRFCTNGSESAGRRGIPTIGLGPGNEEDAHTIDESIALDQLEGARDIYRELVLGVAAELPRSR
ncbi:Succinyl-diaminopimelate desuccinylase [Pandoraea iniqua]|uniref:YgeY family selenium metabolism-linked hydrolase n=1 Tax=Pandoraea iniqua TaxID=2508288 RepID=UPI00124113B3|nr:YgeY family selenium metabolism-linked hydrolase [Pandoraea iniqua]VVD77897.1 Succinyl-diaminopimelate desuccinylase [Pandoraea iniqua]